MILSGCHFFLADVDNEGLSADLFHVSLIKFIALLAQTSCPPKSSPAFIPVVCSYRNAIEVSDFEALFQQIRFDFLGNYLPNLRDTKYLG